MAKKIKLPSGFKIGMILLGLLSILLLWNFIGNYDIQENFEEKNKKCDKESEKK